MGIHTETVDLITRRVIERLAEKGVAGRNPASPTLMSRPHEERILPIGVSVRHCHLTREHFELLFGRGKDLTERNRLYQQTDFAANETLTIVGARLRSIENVRILGPLRKYSQVEVSRTDAVYLGESPDIRESGDVKGTSPITLVGPAGTLRLEEGLILATRHIHLGPEEAEHFGLKTLDEVKVRIRSPKPLVFEGVTIKVYPGHRKEIHLDTDDANAAGVYAGAEAEMFL